MINKLNSFSNLLYFILPFLLITGPFLSDLSVVIISLIFIFTCFYNKDYKIFSNIYFKIFLLFYFILLISSALSEYNLYSLKKSIPYIRFGLFSLGVFLIITKNQHVIKQLAIVYFTIIIILLLDSTFEFVFDKNLLGWKKIDNNFRITSLFGNDEVLGSYVARLFPFGLSILIFSKLRLKFKLTNKYIIFFIASSFYITLISGERTSLALILISLILITLSCSELRKTIMFSFFIILTLSSISIFFKPALKERIYDNVISQMGLFSPDERIKIFSKTYEGHYIIAYKMFKEKPLVGHGVKSFRKYCSEPENHLYPGACTTHPHNIYMQLLSETGFLGFIIIFIIFIVLSFKILNLIINSFIKQQGEFQQCKNLIYIFYFANFFPFLPSGSLFNNWLSIILFMPAGYLIYLEKLKKNK